MRSQTSAMSNCACHSTEREADLSIWGSREQVRAVATAQQIYLPNARLWLIYLLGVTSPGNEHMPDRTPEAPRPPLKLLSRSPGRPALFRTRVSRAG